MNNTPIVIESAYNVPVERVWKAITDKDQMKQWYFNLAEFRPVAGFEFRFAAPGKEENKEFVHICVVTEVITGKKLQYSWRYEGFEGNSSVTFELFAEGDKTRLKLTHEGLESFPATSDFARENFKEGWTYIVHTLLKNFLEPAAG
jgi:uncharacterized protein YndB with AHSA1/START domain